MKDQSLFSNGKHIKSNKKLSSFATHFFHLNQSHKILNDGNPAMILVEYLFKKNTELDASLLICIIRNHNLRHYCN